MEKYAVFSKFNINILIFLFSILLLRPPYQCRTARIGISRDVPSGVLPPGGCNFNNTKWGYWGMRYHDYTPKCWWKQEARRRINPRACEDTTDASVDDYHGKVRKKFKTNEFGRFCNHFHYKLLNAYIGVGEVRLDGHGV